MSLKPAAPGRARWAQGSGTRDPAPSAQPPEGTGRPQQPPPTPHGSQPQHPFSGLSEPGSAAGEKPPPQKGVKTWDAPSAKEGLQAEQWLHGERAPFLSLCPRRLEESAGS